MQRVLKDGKDRYYGRSGSSFVPLSHSQLADLFGRRPRPVLRATVAPVDDRPGARRPHEVRLSIPNAGRGAARMLAFSAWLKTARHEIQVEVHRAQEWRVHARGDGERLTLS